MPLERGPPLSRDKQFDVDVAEGTTLAKRGELDGAIEAFTKALNLKPKSKLVLLKRSECWLHKGHSDKALKDAEATLVDDEKYHRGLYRKAEALYYGGDFEFALVFYHRGRHLRPDIDLFRLGIQKAKDAIDMSFKTAKFAQNHLKSVYEELIRNGISGEDRLRTPGSARGAPPLDFSQLTASTPLATTLSTQRSLSDRSHGRACKTPSRVLLGDLHEDKMYLKNLRKDKTLSWMDKKDEVLEEVRIGLQYISTRSKYWKQRQPFSVLKPPQSPSITGHSPSKSRRSVSETPHTQQPSVAEETSYVERQPQTPSVVQKNKVQQMSKKKYLEHTRYAVQAMENINSAMENGDYELALRFAKSMLKRIVNLEIADKPRILGKLYSNIGNIYIELDKMSLASVHHQKDLDLALKYNYQDAFLRALGNLGLTYKLVGDLHQAIAVWEKKLEFVEDEEVPDLCLQLAKVSLDASEYEKAAKYSSAVLDKAPAEDKSKHMSAYACLGHVHLMTSVYDKALMNFEKAMNIAKDIGDETAEADCLTNLGNTYLALGDAQKSIQLQEQALALSSKAYATPNPA